MTPRKSILYVQTSDVPERQYAPLVLAEAAKEMYIDVLIFYLGQGLRILQKGAAEKIRLGQFPSLYEIIRKMNDAGIQIYACDASRQMLGWDKSDLIPEAKTVSAGSLNDFVLDADAVMWF